MTRLALRVDRSCIVKNGLEKLHINLHRSIPMFMPRNMVLADVVALFIHNSFKQTTSLLQDRSQKFIVLVEQAHRLMHQPSEVSLMGHLHRYDCTDLIHCFQKMVVQWL